MAGTRRGPAALVLVCVLAAASAVVGAQRGGMFRGSPDDLAIKYSTAPLSNAVATLNQKIKDGDVRLAFEGRSGYLQTALAALEIPIESQMLVFSPTSLQAERISAA